MSIFRKKEKLFNILGFVLDSETIRFNDNLLKLVQKGLNSFGEGKSYTQDDLNQLSNIIAEKWIRIDGEVFDINNVFEILPITDVVKWESSIQVVIVKGIKEGLNESPSNNEALNWLNEIGVIYGSQFGSIPEEKLYKSVSNKLFEKFNLKLNKDFELIEMMCIIYSKSSTNQYITALRYLT